MFKPLKVHYDYATNNWTKRTPGASITKYRFGALFNQAWGKSSTVANAVKGFEACGIYPYNPQGIPEEAFSPSESSERAVELAGKESASASAESSLKETESNLPQDGSSALNSYFENILPPPVYERATKSRKKQKTGELTTTSYLEELRQHGAESERQGGSHNKCII